MSPLTWRILAVNMVAPIILVAGLFYLDRYRNELIDNDLQSLTTRAEMVAAAVGEGAVSDSNPGQPVMSPRIAREMVRRLSPPARIQTWLFTPDGRLAADSRDLTSSFASVDVKELPPLETEWVRRTLSRLYNFVVASPLADEDLPQFVEPTKPNATDYPETLRAFGGDSGTGVRRTGDNRLVLSAAVPVQHYKRVLAVVMTTTVADDIKASMFEVRLTIFEAFGVALAATILLSLYLAGTIARPVRRLADAAEQVRRSHGRRHAIPDLASRHDEIGDLSTSLRDMTEALWQRMDAVEAFAADVAHEIKNPLTSLRSAVETVGRVRNEEHRAQLLAIIQDDVSRLDRLISDISDASRIDAELSRVETQRVPIYPMMTAMADIYEQTGAAKGVHITIEANPDDPLPVTGIESRLGQVMRNLIVNALSFSPPNGRLTLRGRRMGDKVQVEVEDQGPGMPDDKLDEIFNRFYSERPLDEKFGTHSGLGLSISRQIVAAYGGTLVAANRKDADHETVGALFTLTLPLNEGPLPALPPRQSRPQLQAPVRSEMER